MNLAALLNPALVIPELAATTKRGVLEELAGLMVVRLAEVNGLSASREQIVEVLLERERLGSTGIGQGVALPHGKLPRLPGTYLALGRSPTGVDFDSEDGEPARLFFLLLSPEGSAQHLLALAALARLVREAALRERLLAAASAQDILEELSSALREL